MFKISQIGFSLDKFNEEESINNSAFIKKSESEFDDIDNFLDIPMNGNNKSSLMRMESKAGPILNTLLRNDSYDVKECYNNKVSERNDNIYRKTQAYFTRTNSSIIKVNSKPSSRNSRVSSRNHQNNDNFTDSRSKSSLTRKGIKISPILKSQGCNILKSNKHIKFSSSLLKNTPRRAAISKIPELIKENVEDTVHNYIVLNKNVNLLNNHQIIEPYLTFSEFHNIYFRNSGYPDLLIILIYLLFGEHVLNYYLTIVLHISRNRPYIKTGAEERATDNSKPAKPPRIAVCIRKSNKN